MGIPITIEIVDSSSEDILNTVFSYFTYVDNKFSTYKETSEITFFNKNKITEKDFSSDMKKIFELAEKTKNETNGFFDIYHNGEYDTSGIVKGWAILNAANILKEKGYKNFYVDAGGDIQVFGKNKKGKHWKIGIQNPFNLKEVVKTIYIYNKGVATSGTYIRGQHVYNPKNNLPITEIVSITVIGPDVYEADRFATAAFAMEKRGINFIENLKGFEGYMIDKMGIATMTSGFETYVDQNSKIKDQNQDKS